MVVALVITSEGFPLAYEMCAGNTADKTTLRGMLATLQRRFGATSFSGIINQLPPETRLCVPKVTATVALRESVDPEMLPAPRGTRAEGRGMRDGFRLAELE